MLLLPVMMLICSAVGGAVGFVGGLRVVSEEHERDKLRLRMHIRALQSQLHTLIAMGDLRSSPRRVAPDEADRAYRTLARLVHPDAGGSDDAMRALNTLREATQ